MPTHPSKGDARTTELLMAELGLEGFRGWGRGEDDREGEGRESKK